MKKKFGKFELLERLGGGGMAEVFRARLHGPSGFTKDVALKLILPQFSDEPDFVKMFIREATVAAQLDHASIVRIHEFDQIEGTYYIAMELVDGKDLRAFSARSRSRERPLSVAEVLAIAIDVARGLAFAHGELTPGREPIVHRDISPHNIIVSRAGEVKITDFGIAKMASTASLTKTGVVKGKAAYMSPEQARGESVDARSDIFSLGCVMWELLTGQRLFSGENDLAILEKLQRCQIEPCSRFNPRVPPELDQVVERALSREPDDRFARAGDMARAMDRLLSSQVPDRTYLLADLYRDLFGAARTETAVLPAVPEKTPVGNETPAHDSRWDTSDESAPGSKFPPARLTSPTADTTAATATEPEQPAALVPLAAGLGDTSPPSNLESAPVASGGEPDSSPPAAAATDQYRSLGPDEVTEIATTMLEDSPRWLGRRWLRLTGFAVLLLVLVGGGYWLFSGFEPDASEASPEQTDGGRRVPRNQVFPSFTAVGRVGSALADILHWSFSTAAAEPDAGAATSPDAGGTAPADGVPGGGSPPVKKHKVVASREAATPTRRHRPAKPATTGKRNKPESAARPTRAHGKLDLNVIPWARVYWHGRYLGDTPLRNVGLPAGRQKLVLVNPDLGVRRTVTVTIKAGATRRRLVDISSPAK